MSGTLRFGPGGATPLGPLEQRIMDVLWSRDDWSTVADVVSGLERGTGAPSYSAVKAVLANLVQKNIARKRDADRAKTYRATQSRETFERGVVDDVLAPLLRSHRTPLLASLAEGLIDDEDAIREFERLIAERRAQPKT
jgi:predicted transcriptional regulator